MDFNAYAYDEKLAEEGRKLPLGGGAFLVICRWGNAKFVKRFNDLTKPYGPQSANFGKFGTQSNIPDDKMIGIMKQLVAETILVDWGGMTEDGEPLDYSVDNAIAIFTKHEKFMLDVIEQAQDDANFKRDLMEEELGNSGTDSEANSESAEETEKP